MLYCNHADCCAHCESCNPPEPSRDAGSLRRMFGPPIWEQLAEGGEK